MKTFPRGGVHPSDNKLSRAEAVEVLALPDVVNVPLSQHIGAPAVAKVAKGDKVKVGELIAEAARFRVGQYPCARVGHRDGGGYAAQRAGNPPDDDYDPSRGG